MTTFNESELRATGAQIARMEDRLTIARKRGDRLAIGNLEREIARMRKLNESALRSFAE